MSSEFAPVLLYTLHCGNLYGTERMALATLEGMVGRRRIVVAPPSDYFPSLLSECSLRQYDTKAFGSFVQLIMALLSVFLKHRQVDVISTSATHNLLCKWMARVLFVKVRQLNVVHGGGEDKYSYANKHKLNNERVLLVAVSDFVRRKLLDHRVKSDKIVVIHNFLSVEVLKTRPRRPSFDISDATARPLIRSKVRVTVVSRLDPVKRLDVLLSAIEMGGLDDFTFDVFGTGEMLNLYRARAVPLRGTVNFLGYDPDIPSRLPAADLFLHLCPDEPFGLVVLEAFAARVPVIVPDAGGAAELVVHGVTGMTFSANNAVSLISRLDEIADFDGERLDSIAQAGLASLQKRFAPHAGVVAYQDALALVR